jgi:hypothetical protein
MKVNTFVVNHITKPQIFYNTRAQSYKSFSSVKLMDLGTNISEQKVL